MSDPCPRLLLVDDHALYLTGLRLMLAQAWPDAEVRVASTWGEAQAELVNQPADLVLLDIHLPDAHGLAMLPRWRARWPEVPVLVMSADVDGVLVQQAREAGAAGYLPKSAQPDDVVAAVRTCLEGGQAWAHLPYGLLQPPVAEVSSALVVAEPGRSLSPLQAEILKLVGRGQAPKAIARALGLPEGDVRAELSWVTESLNASSREQAFELALQRGWLTP